MTEPNHAYADLPVGLEPRDDGVNRHNLVGCNAYCSGDIHATIAFREPKQWPARLDSAQHACDHHHAEGNMPAIELLSVEDALEHPPDSRPGYSNGWLPYLVRWKYRG